MALYTVCNLRSASGHSPTIEIIVFRCSVSANARPCGEGEWILGDCLYWGTINHGEFPLLSFRRVIHKWSYSAVRNKLLHSHAQRNGWNRANVRYDLALGAISYITSSCSFHGPSILRFRRVNSLYFSHSIPPSTSSMASPSKNMGSSRRDSLCESISAPRADVLRTLQPRRVPTPEPCTPLLHSSRALSVRLPLLTT